MPLEWMPPQTWHLYIGGNIHEPHFCCCVMDSTTSNKDLNALFFTIHCSFSVDVEATLFTQQLFCFHDFQFESVLMMVMHNSLSVSCFSNKISQSTIIHEQRTRCFINRKEYSIEIRIQTTIATNMMCKRHKSSWLLLFMAHFLDFSAQCYSP